MSVYTVTDSVRESLAESFVEERDLLDALRDARGGGEMPAAEGLSLAVTLTVRRPMDLETAELRRVSVQMRPTSGGFEVFAIEGLPSPPATGDS